MENGPTHTVSKRKTSWLPQALTKVERCAQAVEGWDSYGGLPLNPAVRKHSTKLLELVETEPLPVPAVTLGSGGTLGIGWHHAGRELEIEVFEEGTLGYLKVFPNQETEEGSVKSEVEEGWRALVRWLLNG